MNITSILARNLTRKVPEITNLFWIIKLLTTAMGEALSDFLVFHINAYVSVIAGFLFFLVALALQFYVKKYIPWIYWFAAGMVAVFGTMAADVIHVVFLVPYFVSSIFFFIALLGIFFFWYKSEHTLSIHTITTTKREMFYWATVVVTFALGTAVGDLTASTFHLGYLISGVFFALCIFVPAVLYLKFKANEVATFWIAYILTRPLGASFADWIGKTKVEGGLGIGTGILSIVLIGMIITCLVYIHFSRKETMEEKGIS